jgi:hypothetical protein
VGVDNIDAERSSLELMRSEDLRAVEGLGASLREYASLMNRSK